MKTMTLELPDELCEAVTRASEDSHRPLSEYVANRLRASIPARKPALTPEEYKAARQRLQRHFGAVATGDPHSADNERIDADMMREYADTHEDAS
jgi:hypothetical protein